MQRGGEIDFVAGDGELVKLLWDHGFGAAAYGCLPDLTKSGGLLVITTPNSEDLELGMTTRSAMLAVRSVVQRRDLGGSRGSFMAPKICRPARGANLDPAPLPDYIDKLRRNERRSIGSESDLLQGSVEVY